MTITRGADKTTLDRLQDLPKIDWAEGQPIPETESALMSFEDGGFKFDFLWRPKEGADRLFVLFSGDALRAKNDPPVFQRWSWAKHFPGHCLYISDPTLHLNDEMGLAWYAGTESYDPMVVIADRLKAIAGQIGLSTDRIVSYGSSGGGFAAIRLQSFLSDILAISINPQTCITKYKSRAVPHYFDVCFSGRSRKAMLEEFPSQINLMANADALTGDRIIYAQNTVDTHHLEDHFTPFCEAMGQSANHDPDSSGLHRILFDNEGGHKKAEDPETFTKIMELVENLD
ncbi:hypothetical protein [Shimia thalassica]|uniref:hypothetical protein n=1 Tax=Shimia thalassica TaxID=1715693 RepID=UPI0026E2522C|nr:hypothetical protein [Shimia thalassica]MDO6799745.1 hypothetical protein [Shimia thalassica]